jgi:hypothetical protein
MKPKENRQLVTDGSPTMQKLTTAERTAPQAGEKVKGKDAFLDLYLFYFHTGKKPLLRERNARATSLQVI